VCELGFCKTTSANMLESSRLPPTPPAIAACVNASD
jgi:hypothetical protein